MHIRVATDVNIAQVCRHPYSIWTCAQVLDGQAILGDRAAAADYSTRQAAQQATDAAAQESNSSLAATSQRSKATGSLQSGLPGSPQRGLSKSRSTSLKHRKSRDVGGATSARLEDTSSVAKSDEVAGKLYYAAACEVHGLDTCPGPRSKTSRQMCDDPVPLSWQGPTCKGPTSCSSVAASTVHLWLPPQQL